MILDVMPLPVALVTEFWPVIAAIAGLLAATAVLLVIRKRKNREDDR